ncbi:hypothetical protein HY488_01755 [Candidatus Woesearchaeota archaeon]|nr:hypothetical protein [Candidatus Woesearchaeota archaeon]
MLTKKGQMEMIGIAIVVVLIVIGATLFLTLSIKPASKAHAAFAQKELAQNIVDALVKTVTTCRGLDFAAVLEDCAKNGDSGIVCEDTRRSCQYAREEISGILDRILGTRTFQYRFSATKDLGGAAFDDISTTSCTMALIQNGDVVVETPGIQPIPLYPGTLTLMLQICTPLK